MHLGCDAIHAHCCCFFFRFEDLDFGEEAEKKVANGLENLNGQ